MREEVLKIISKSVEEIAEEREITQLQNVTETTPLFGAGGYLDSLGLVQLISDVEDEVSEKLNKDIVLADVLAMSAKISPFRSIASLTDFTVKKMLDE